MDGVTENRRIFLNDEKGVFRFTVEASVWTDDRYPPFYSVWSNTARDLPIAVRWNRQWGVRIRRGDEEKGKRLLIMAALKDTEDMLVNLSKLIKGEPQNEDNNNNGAGHPERGASETC